MKFGRTLSSSIHEPWRSSYIDYDKLKLLLREEKREGSGASDLWTDDDEARFVEQLLNVELEKVNAFQVEKYQDLNARTGQCEAKLESLHLTEHSIATAGLTAARKAQTDNEQQLRDIVIQLDAISEEINKLEKFSRMNFSGFRKIVKKHDRKRGSGYRLRALLSSKLASLPLNTEDYSPLLYRLSAMYSFVRRHLQDGGADSRVADEPRGDEQYDSMTFFVHPEDLVEVKTFVLRHLPVLVYNPKTSKVVEVAQHDPSLTSVYFDSDAFSLYKSRLVRRAGASSLRLRWFGSFDEVQDVTLEQKITAEGEGSREQRISLKRKHILPFLGGSYRLEKKIARLREQGGDATGEAEALEARVADMQHFITTSKLKPMLRATYKRVAFQVPGDDTIRVSIDTDLKFSYEDQTSRKSAHLRDGNTSLESVTSASFPSSTVNGEDSSVFPWAVLTLKLHDERESRGLAWVRDLTSSHLLREAPRFSKFVHGIASLYEDSVAELPFWMSLIDTDIRRDPHAAFAEEQDREEQRMAENEAVGSYGGTPRRKSSLHPYALPHRDEQSRQSDAGKGSYSMSPHVVGLGESESLSISEHAAWLPRLREVIPMFANPKQARSRQVVAQLPPGVEEPKTWIKDEGPLKVEPKVWLANQRTFIKWQHVSVLLASLSLGLYNSAGPRNDLARSLAILYTVIAVIIAIWGWTTYNVRSRAIRERSGKDLDSVFGPVLVCLSLGVALCLNLGLRVGA